MSTLYGTEVPAYNLLVEVAREVNERYVSQHGASAERLGSIARVTAERHGAIRVGSPTELVQVSHIFGALGMYPTGFYDLRDAAPNPIPVVSTAFRPRDRAELAANPFRIFTSMLVPEDRRFFNVDMERRLKDFIARRTLFPSELLKLADTAESEGGLDEKSANVFLDLAADSFALSREPVDRVWSNELDAISSVASDIGGVRSTHINHLTPRVLDIDDLYASMQERGIEMIDQIQGPPRWEGPDVLLRQTSFRALSEPRVFREQDGSHVEGSLRVRFGEVEARGIALTPMGRDLYDRTLEEIDSAKREDPSLSHQVISEQIWRNNFPNDEFGLLEQGLGFFTFRLAGDKPSTELPSTDLIELVREGLVVAEPIVYEDFLPRSAAGIFSSNLSSSGAVQLQENEAFRDIRWMSKVLGHEVARPEDLYAVESSASVADIERQLGVSLVVG